MDNLHEKMDLSYNDYETSNTEFDDAHDTSSVDLANMDPEERQKLEEHWRQELSKTEEEINTLRTVLGAKMKHAAELKRKLSITVWKEFQQDLGQGMKNIQETTAYQSSVDKLLTWNSALQTAPIYQKTSEVVKIAGEKTTSIFGNLGETFSRKLGEVKNSNTFKSFEEKVGSTVSNVKSKMGGSRSNSINSFEDSLNAERRNSQTATPATTPTIPE